MCVYMNYLWWPFYQTITLFLRGLANIFYPQWSFHIAPSRTWQNYNNVHYLIISRWWRPSKSSSPNSRPSSKVPHPLPPLWPQPLSENLIPLRRGSGTPPLRKTIQEGLSLFLLCSSGQLGDVCAQGIGKGTHDRGGLILSLITFDQLQCYHLIVHFSWFSLLNSTLSTTCYKQTSSSLIGAIAPQPAWFTPQCYYTVTAVFFVQWKYM